MKGSPTRHYANALALVIVLAAMLIGGIFIRKNLEFGENQHSSNPYSNTRFQQWTKDNLCGVLSLNGPFYEINGTFSRPVPENSGLYLFLLKNLSAAATSYAATNCRWLAAIHVSSDGQFSLPFLPHGTYALVTKNGLLAGRLDTANLQVFSKDATEIPTLDWQTTRSAIIFSIQ